MAKSKSHFVCQNCSASFPKWMGQCSECQAWNTLVEEVEQAAPTGRQAQGKNTLSETEIAQKRIEFSQVKRVSGTKNRFSTSIGELDRVLGGGLVAGMVVLLGGEPAPMSISD